MKKIILIAIIGLNFNLFAQKSQIKKADKEYENNQLIAAQTLYLKTKDIEKYPEAILKLANTYYFNSDYKSALDWYKKYFILKEWKVKENVVEFNNYKQCLKATGKYNQDLEIEKQLLQEQEMDLKKNDFYSGNYSVAKLNNNLSGDVFGLAYYNDFKNILFSSNKKTSSDDTEVHEWSDKPFLKLYTAEINEENNLVNYSILSKEINEAAVHQSNATVTKDGKRIYFTRNLDKDLKIYTAELKNGTWTNISMVPYPVNKFGTSSGHPSIGLDNKLYFVSNRENTFDSNIYTIELNEYGIIKKKTFTILPEEINTSGREDFVYINDDGIIYFSSDGREGYGGLDIYAAKYDESKKKYKVINLGNSINSSYDDFGFVLNPNNKMGFMSSNRLNVNEDVLYSIKEIESINWGFNTNPIVSGKVLDSITNVGISNAILKIYDDETNKLIFEKKTNDNGYFNFELTPFTKTKINIEANNYVIKNISLPKLELYEKKNVDIYLLKEKFIEVDRKLVEVNNGDDLAKILKLTPIYFDYNGSQLRKTSMLELDKIIKILEDRPNANLLVTSHTDNRGSDEYNMKLSEKRVQTTISYILENSSISSGRISGEGFGESKPLNNCKDCSEEEHQLNRRSEFLINFN